MRRLEISTCAVVTLLALSLAAGESGETDEALEAEGEEAAVEEAALALPDTTGAALWSYLQDVDYQEEWALWPGKSRLYEGQEPHGMLLTTYLNEEALTALRSQVGIMPEGAIIVKENYTPDSILAAVTVMYKVADYNPEHNDWFFTKHTPGGELEITPTGMPMEGRLQGCQACHGAQRANDYLFTGSLTAGGGGE